MWSYAYQRLHVVLFALQITPHVVQITTCSVSCNTCSSALLKIVVHYYATSSGACSSALLYADRSSALLHAVSSSALEQ